MDKVKFESLIVWFGRLFFLGTLKAIRRMPFFFDFDFRKWLPYFRWLDTCFVSSVYLAHTKFAFSPPTVRAPRALKLNQEGDGRPNDFTGKVEDKISEKKWSPITTFFSPLLIASTGLLGQAGLQLCSHRQPVQPPHLQGGDRGSFSNHDTGVSCAVELSVKTVA